MGELGDDPATAELIARHSREVIIRTDAEGVIVQISPSIRQFGYTPEDFIGRTGAEYVHPDDLPRFERNCAALLRGELESGERREHRFRRSDGEWLWVEGNPEVLRDPNGQIAGIVNVFRDVTHRRGLEELARAQAELFQTAFRYAAVGEALVGLDGSFLRVNAAFSQITGYSERALANLDFQSITHPDDLDKDLGLLSQLNAGEIDSYRMDKRYVRPGGQLVWAHLAVSMVRRPDGSPKHYVAQVLDLSERRAAEAAHAESEARYKLIAENTSDMIILTDLKGITTFATPSVRRTGWSAEELVGRPFTEFAHPDDLPKMYEVFSNLLQTGQSDRIRWRGRHRKTGAWVWLESNPSLLRDPQTGEPKAFIDAVRDVSEQVAQETALAESETRYKLIAENTSDMIIMTDIAGRVTYVSGACRRLGWEPEDLMAQGHALEGIHPDDIPAVRASSARLVAGEPAARVRWRGQRKDLPGWIWLESNPSLLRDPVTGAPTGVLDAVRDVSEQVAQEEALAKARAMAEAAAAAKSQFLANMSHEIRTPLTAVLGFTRLVKEIEGLPEAAQAYVGKIAGAGNGLLAIVNDILDFSKLEAGRFEVRPRPVDPVLACRETLDLFTEQAAAKGLALSFEAGGGLPHIAMLDGDRLRQMLINLIGNAVKFTEAGGVTLRVGPGAAPGEMAIAVADTGPGLDAAAQATLFQRFTQIDGSMTRQHGGTGLGLAICRGIAEAMGGAVSVESAPGQGSTFRVALPAPAAELPSELAEAGPPAAVDGVRVFVVDDNAANRELTRRILQAAGAEVEDASSGEAAVERLALAPHDVVLMDLRMPGLDGRSALRRLRAEPGPNQDIPVLAFTADADLAGEDDLAGFDGLVRKPIQPMDMYQAIAQATQWAPQAAEDVADVA